MTHGLMVRLRSCLRRGRRGRASSSEDPPTPRQLEAELRYNCRFNGIASTGPRRRRAVRHLAAVGAAPVLRPCHARRRADAVDVLGWPSRDRAVIGSVGAHGSMVRDAIHAARLAALAVHQARSQAGAVHRDRARRPVSRHPQPADHGRAKRSVQGRNRGSLRRRLHRRRDLYDRSARSAGGSDCAGHRAAARGRALQLREPSDFDWCHPPRHERGPVSPAGPGPPLGAAIHGTADGHQELLPAG